jgi:heme o synthase
VKKSIQTFSDLIKLRVSLLITLSTAAGFILAKGFEAEIAFPVFGVFLLAAGSLALNQVQERKIDALMERTKKRPLPTGRLHVKSAVMISLVLLVLGSSILFIKTNLTALALGLFSVIWYNGFYTFFKRRSAFAAVPGALIGALPPLIGWTAGSGSLFDPKIMAVAFFFFVWQVPHFWLLLLSSGDDYEKAGLPSLQRVFTKEQIARVTFIWILATAVTGFMIPLFDVVNSFWVNLFFLLSILWLIVNAVKILREEEREEASRFAFNAINIYAFFVISFLSLSRFLSLFLPN